MSPQPLCIRCRADLFDAIFVVVVISFELQLDGVRTVGSGRPFCEPLLGVLNTPKSPHDSMKSYTFEATACCMETMG